MRNALRSPEETVTAHTPQPWKLIDDCNATWFEEQLKERAFTQKRERPYRKIFLGERKRQPLDMSPLQEPGWSPQREAEWEATWEDKVAGFRQSVVPRYVERVLAHAALVSLASDK
jgi:hypothetical protein